MNTAAVSRLQPWLKGERGALALLAAACLIALIGRTASAGILVVSDSSQVLQFNAQTGAFWGGPANGLANPHGLCFRGDGNLFVGVDGTNSILHYDGWAGTFFGTFVTSGSGGLNSPQYITSGPDGNLYVSSTFSDNVLQYNDTSGAHSYEFYPSDHGV